MDQPTLLFPSYTDAKRGQFYDQKYCAGDLGRYPSGQRGQTVNLLPSASKVRILACPPNRARSTASVLSERASGAQVGEPDTTPSVSAIDQGGRSSAVESQPSKLAVVGSTPTARSKWRTEIRIRRLRDHQEAARRRRHSRDPEGSSASMATNHE